jgi:branched-chain amino acid transport system permease protein
MGDILIVGFLRGSLYSLIAVGFVLIFSVGRILNLSHGIFYMMGAYFTYIFYTYLLGGGGRVSVFFAMLLAIFAVVLLGLFVYVFIYRRHIKTSKTMAMSINAVMVMALCINLFSSELMSLLFGITAARVPPVIEGSTDIWGVRCINQELLFIPITATILLGLWAFLRHNRIGRSIYAVAQNKYAATLMGVNSEMSIIVTVILSSLFAALAGTLVSSIHSVVPYMWVFPLIKSFCIAIAGGMGSILGAVIASFLLGFAEVATALCFSEHYADFVSLFMLGIILIAKPEGLMGAK